MQKQLTKIDLPELKYSYSSLEPVLISDILEVHHKKHHNGYVNNYNRISEDIVDAFYKNDTFKVQSLCQNLNFNSGGHNCHALYWDNLAPKDNGGGILPNEKSNLTKAIQEVWGNYNNFMEDFNKKTGSIQGSGWGWLAYNPNTQKLTIEQTIGQDSVETNGKIPLLTVDVWEHAYYLQYKNLRPDYLKKIWDIINWNEVEKRFLKSTL